MLGPDFPLRVILLISEKSQQRVGGVYQNHSINNITTLQANVLGGCRCFAHAWGLDWGNWESIWCLHFQQWEELNHNFVDLNFKGVCNLRETPTPR